MTLNTARKVLQAELDALKRLLERLGELGASPRQVPGGSARSRSYAEPGGTGHQADSGPMREEDTLKR